jgi:16S rRNA processing protein RimM
MLLVVGRVGRAHGVLGEATIEIRTDMPDERFFVGHELLTDPPIHGPVTIESVRYNNGILLLKFKQFADRTEIEKIRDTLLLVDVDLQEELISEDNYHVQQLLNLKVMKSSGEEIGIVSDVLNLPGQDVLVILKENREVLVPFTREFVPHVDLKLGVIIVNPPEGLLDMEQQEDRSIE